MCHSTHGSGHPEDWLYRPFDGYDDLVELPDESHVLSEHD